ncbi:MAG TPA: PD-(D/E)XK nuclease family protein [Candidatus Krumholzibacteria bacterium]|nr:PD-(D/E)XK nuclease family protein [Candidatus Krumholzibacteria bacterium]HPD72975.1 PD-(D/E)XK nuclease family protein [Candidatus Krumholzibacteria bacterium]HRY41774.1 PD-(D/E)XK nuclease family protein [Candidatus Krumholzibacteria bacterium]
MKTSFFEAVSIARMERMHSQMIAWIFSQDCEAISLERKHQLLATLSRSSASALRGPIRSHTEWNHIDVVLETETSVIFIENKIKSSQGSDQLERYNAIVANPIGTELLGGRTPVKVLLTLVREQPRADGWIELSYRDFVRRLSEALDSPDDGTEDSTIVTAYVRSLARLTNIVEAFCAAPDRFANVFQDGGRSLADKLEMSPLADDDCQYVRNMQLETVLQRLYVTEIARRIAPDDALVIIGETRGTALLDIKQPKVLKTVLAGAHEFDWGIQFQGRTVKVQLESGWKSQSEKKPVSPAMRRYMESNLIPAVEEFAKRPEIASSWRFNRPKTGSGTAYCSLSRQKHSGEPLLWGRSWDEAEVSYRVNFAAALEMATELQRHLEPALSGDIRS